MIGSSIARKLRQANDITPSRVAEVNTLSPENGYLTLPTDDTMHLHYYVFQVIRVIAVDCVELYDPAVDHHRPSRSGNLMRKTGKQVSI